jgi:hypothetical protein
MISIHIEAHPDRGNLKDQVDASLAAIGFARTSGLVPLPTVGGALAQQAAQERTDAQNSPVASDPSADKTPEPVAEPAKAEEKPAPKPRGRSKKDETPAAPPAAEPEVAAQDAADETAEAEADAPAVQDPEEPEVFTRDSIRKELGAYATAYGMEHALTDGPSIIEAKNASAVEETQEALGKATRALRAAIVSNPFERAPANAAA